MQILTKRNGQEYFNRTCPYCKESVELYRSNNNAVMFDNQVFHLECFLKSKQIQKKCKHCKKSIQFQTLEDIENLKPVYYQGSYYCHDCFKKLCQDGIGRKSVKWKNANANIEKYITTAFEQLKKILINKIKSYGSVNSLQNDVNEYANKVFAEHDVDDLIRDNYGIIDISNIYNRHLKPLYNGTSNKYKDVKIPPYHLLEMWKTKLPYLRKVYQKNIANGKDFTPTQHVLYDLAILVSRYEGFLEWKNKQAVLEANDNNVCASNNAIEKIDYTKIKPTKISDRVNDDIDNILSDIFD